MVGRTGKGWGLYAPADVPLKSSATLNPSYLPIHQIQM
jgi:hypothetical protein